MKKHGIFAALAPWSGSGQGAGQRLYYCRFAEDGAIVHDYVPAKRLSDGVLGMYDRTTGEFKTNAGSGAFTAGPERAERAFATGELHLPADAAAGAWNCSQIKVASNVAVVADGGHTVKLNRKHACWDSPFTWLRGGGILRRAQSR